MHRIQVSYIPKLQGPNQQWMEYVNELSKLTEDKASPTSERRLTQIVSQAVRAHARVWTCVCCCRCTVLSALWSQSIAAAYPSRDGHHHSS